MACTNRLGWPGYRWGRGPDWTTTGVIRPVTEIQHSISIPVDHYAGDRADQALVNPALTLQPARGAIRQGVAVVDLAGWEPAVRHDQGAAVPGGFVGQHGRDQPHCGIRHRPAKRPAAHTAFHRGHVEIFDHDVAV